MVVAALAGWGIVADRDWARMRGVWRRQGQSEVKVPKIYQFTVGVDRLREQVGEQINVPDTAGGSPIDTVKFIFPNPKSHTLPILSHLFRNTVNTPHVFHENYCATLGTAFSVALLRCQKQFVISVLPTHLMKIRRQGCKVGFVDGHNIIGLRRQNVQKNVVFMSQTLHVLKQNFKFTLNNLRRFQ